MGANLAIILLGLSSSVRSQAFVPALTYSDSCYLSLNGALKKLVEALDQDGLSMDYSALRSVHSYVSESIDFGIRSRDYYYQSADESRKLQCPELTQAFTEAGGYMDKAIAALIKAEVELSSQALSSDAEQVWSGYALVASQLVAASESIQVSGSEANLSMQFFMECAEQK